MGNSIPRFTPEEIREYNTTKHMFEHFQQVDVSVECEDSIEVEDRYTLVKFNEASTIYKIII